MKERDFASSLLLIGVGILFLIGSLQQGLIRRGIPGAGFFPFICALILICLSLAVFTAAFFERKKGEERVEEGRFFPERNSLRKLLFALICLLAYGLFLKQGGFLLVTFLFMLLMMRMMEPHRWRMVITLSLSTAVLCYLLFAGMDVNLPEGIFSEILSKGGGIWRWVF